MPRRKGGRAFWTLDCETDPFRAGRVSQPFIWGLYGGPTREDYHEFATAAEVVAFLSDRKEVVYAHNGGKFDYHYLREYINTGEPIQIITGRLARFRIGECEFRDSMNILPVSLATFKKDEVDYSIFEPDERIKPHNAQIIRQYLRHDCQYLYELIEEHRKENGTVLTQASASMRAWSKHSQIKPPKQTERAYRQYKPYYYGGRVQCFEQGVRDTNFTVIDINSAYPYAMLYEHPFSPVGELKDRLPADGKLHRCLITLTCTARGCFPHRLGDDPTKGDLYFPHDEHTIRRYYVTGYEFIAALKRDAVKNISIESVYEFSECVKFEDFIQHHWSRRAEAKRQGNKALDIIVKLLMNSLYGKFASDYSKYKEYMLEWTDYLPAAYKDGWNLSTDWGNDRLLLYRAIPEEKFRFYNIATAASITGFVRAQLFEALSDVSFPIYCDTDSIACGSTGSLALGENLGAWKIEGTFDRYAIAGKKTYAFHKANAPVSDALDSRKDYAHYKVASKGVDLPPSDIERVAAGKTVRYSPEVPTYSVKRNAPIFIGRDVRSTAKDIRQVPS